jgi:hypothetical protein
MKNRFVFSFIFILFSLIFISIAYAQTNQSEPKLSFGSIQYQKAATATPGANFSFDLYFFIDQEYGTRTAHVQLGLNYPEGWNVYVIPSQKQYSWNISGIIVNSTENLYVDPRPLLQSIPEPGEEGIYYIASPSGRGYLQAKKATVYVQIPEDAKIGESYQISVFAKANYFGGEGGIMFSQSRSFNFDVKIVAPQYTEQLVTEPKEKATENTTNTSSSNVSSNELGITGEQASGNSISYQQSQLDMGIYIIIAAVIIALAIIITKYIPFSQKPYKKNYEKEIKKNQRSKKNDKNPE